MKPSWSKTPNEKGANDDRAALLERSNGGKGSFLYRPSEDVFSRQDEVLEDMEGSVARLGQMGLEINQELIHQNDLIIANTEQLEVTGDLMDRVQGRMGLLLKKSGCSHLSCIACLCVTMCVLLLLVIYT